MYKISCKLMDYVFANSKFYRREVLPYINELRTRYRRGFYNKEDAIYGWLSILYKAAILYCENVIKDTNIRTHFPNYQMEIVATIMEGETFETFIRE